MDSANLPKSLLAATRYFADPDVALTSWLRCAGRDGVDVPTLRRETGVLPQLPPHLEVHGEGLPQAIQRQDLRACLRIRPSRWTSG